jgi:hypothetical protein
MAVKIVTGNLETPEQLQAAREFLLRQPRLMIDVETVADTEAVQQGKGSATDPWAEGARIVRVVVCQSGHIKTCRNSNGMLQTGG